MLCGSSRYIWTSGHRSVGGYRANVQCFANESVQVLVDVMQALESKV
jgi:phosphoserine aminotransferase